jgi:hypothetical protein
MKREMRWTTAAIVGVCISGVLAAPAAARVVFTGYGDLRFTPGSQTDILGEPAVLTRFGITDRKIEARQFTVDAFGLFASTSFGENFSFNADVTFRQFRFNATDVRIQYAYLDYAPREDVNLQLGKITLPFGHYNQNRFYSFQREELSPPTFQSGILGLPISDIGFGARKTFDWDPFDLNLSLYAVNGYSNVTGNPNALRIPAGLGLALANSLIATNSNEEISYGGQLELANLLGQDLRVGVSGYSGPWDSKAQKNFNMGNVHAVWKYKRLELAAEGLVIDADGDQGFFAVVGNTDWRTTGFFVRGVYHLADPWEMPLYLHSRYEETRTEGDGGGVAREYLRSVNGGLSLKVNDNLTIKSEVADLYYELPVIGAGILGLDVRSLTLGASVSF